MLLKFGGFFQLSSSVFAVFIACSSFLFEASVKNKISLSHVTEK